MAFVLWAQEETVRRAPPWLSAGIWFPTGTVMTARCHVMREAFHLIDTLSCRRPLVPIAWSEQLPPALRG